ncbi:MAG: polysaccharide lyase family 7 protein [Cyclobacteriaceae bacterium]
MKIAKIQFDRTIDYQFKLPYYRLLLLVVVLNFFGYSTQAQDLDPTVPPGENFDLSNWKITLPSQSEVSVVNLVAGYENDKWFYTDTVTGAMVFVCPNDGQTGGSTYPRSELREMLRGTDESIGTQGINKNNWVFSSSTLENQEAAGGVDGVMNATVAVDYVSKTSDESRKIGRVIIGQIHASDDEPCRLYYRKLPNNTKGSIYLAHEPTTSSEQWYDMIGSRSDNASDPEDGIALGEKFSYQIKVVHNTLTVTIMRDGKDDVVQEVDMTDSGFADDWMYFKAGNYNQNNAGDAGEYAQVSFFSLDVSHSSPAPPTEFDAPSDIPRFKPFLAGSKLQAPNSSALANNTDLNNGFTHPTYFYVVDGDKIRFNQNGDSRRTELRHETNWDLTQVNRSLYARLDIVEQTCDQVTVLQIHDDANAGSGPNKPLLRIYKHQTKEPANHIWAVIKTDVGGVNNDHIDLGADPGGYFNCDIKLIDGKMIIDFNGEEKVNRDVSFWTFPSYWKAGVYLQDDGEATAHFDELFEDDGSSQNRFPSIGITSPANNENFEPGTDIVITADAEDSDGSVTLVEFFEGINKLGEATTAPYTYTWSGAADGAYVLSAKATDNEGVSRTSLGVNITVGVKVDVTGVEIPATGSIALGGTLQLDPIISPSDATIENVTYTSSDPNIAPVSNKGLVTGIAVGSATVTVKTVDGGFTDAITIHVLAPSTGLNWALNQIVTATGEHDGTNAPANLVDGDVISRWSVQEFPKSATVDLGADITVNQTEVICFEDRAYQFTIEGSLTENGTYTTLVDRTNNTTPGAPNSPIIDAVENVLARYIRVTVTGADVYTGPWVSLTELRVFGEGDRPDVLVTGVALDESSFELLEGNTKQLTATVSPTNATNKGVSFSSSDAAIATVDGNGLVTAVAAGTASINVTTEDGGLTASAQVTVTRLPVLANDDIDETIILSPNPAVSFVQIKGAGNYRTAIVFDQTGRVVMQKDITQTKTISIEDLRSGIYMIKLIGSDSSEVKRLIKR